LHCRTCSGESPSSTPEGSSLNQALIRPAKQWTDVSSGTIPLFSWSLACSSWLFSGFKRKTIHSILKFEHNPFCLENQPKSTVRQFIQY